MATAAATMVSSPGMLLAMLNENNLKLHAITNLITLVDNYWPEISASVPVIESICEDETIDESQRQLAALLVSKVFCNMGELHDSLSYALRAGPLFDVSEDSDYVRTIMAEAIDEYASLKMKAAESNDETSKVDPRLEVIVERMLNKCIADGRYQQAVVMSIQCQIVDKLVETITGRDKIEAILSYCCDASVNSDFPVKYMREAECIAVKVFRRLPSPDYSIICQLLTLYEPENVAAIFETLLRSDNRNDALLAFRVASDLMKCEQQDFLLGVCQWLSKPKVRASVSAGPDSTTNTTSEVVQMTGVPEAIEGVDDRESRYRKRLTEFAGIIISNIGNRSII